MGPIRDPWGHFKMAGGVASTQSQLPVRLKSEPKDCIRSGQSGAGFEQNFSRGGQAVIKKEKEPLAIGSPFSKIPRPDRQHRYTIRKTSDRRPPPA